ncbi:MAG: EamA family transporter [Rhodospirillaceae bacterium]|nr:EamA family transporter [Rhodospirillaceae bacterium]
MQSILKALHPNIKGSLWMLGMVVSLCLLAVAARELSSRHGPFEIQIMRHSLSLIFLIPFILKYRNIRTIKFPLQLLRNTSHFCATSGWVIAITLIPLSEVFAIEFTTPIWVAVLAVLFLGEKISFPKIVSLLFGIIGIIIILRPGFNVVGVGTLIMIFSAIGFAITNTTTKALTRHDSLISVLFWMSAIQLPLSLIASLFKINMILLEDIPWVLLIGLCGILSHYSLTKAMQLAEASLVNPVDFLRLPLISILGFYIYQESIDIFVIIGALIIFLGNYYAIWNESKRNKLN